MYLPSHMVNYKTYLKPQKKRFAHWNETWCWPWNRNYCWRDACLGIPHAFIVQYLFYFVKLFYLWRVQASSDVERWWWSTRSMYYTWIISTVLLVACSFFNAAVSTTFKVPREELLKTQVFLHNYSRRFVNSYRCFGESFCFHLRGLCSLRKIRFCQQLGIHTTQ
jgi:hypothetical protein